MKTRKRIFEKATVGSLLLVAATFFYANRAASAGAPRPTAVELIGLGAVTLTPSQGMRVNLVNAIESSTVRLTVKFIDNEGRVLKSEQHSLSPGSTSGSAIYVPTDFSAATLVAATPTPVHVIVESVPDTPETPPFPFVMPSVEVFDRKAGGKVTSLHASFQRLNATTITGGQ